MTQRPRGIWVRLNAAAYLDPAVARISLSAEVLFYRSIQYAALTGSGGVIDARSVRVLVQKMRKTSSIVVEELLNAHLWVQQQGGDTYLIRNFAKYNPEGDGTAEDDVSARRERDRVRKRQARSGDKRAVSADTVRGNSVPTIQTNGQGPDRTPPGPVRSGPAQAAPRGAGGAAQPAPKPDVVKLELEATREKLQIASAKYRAKTQRPPTVGNGREERVDFSATLAKLTEFGEKLKASNSDDDSEDDSDD